MQVDSSIPGQPPGAGMAGSVPVVVVVFLLLSRNLKLVPQADATDRPSCERFVGRNLGALHVLLIAWAIGAVVARVR